MAIHRIHLSQTADLQPVSLPQSEVKKGDYGKPKGLWYGINNSWSDWLNDNPGIKDYSYGYEMELDLAGIIEISTPERLKSFVQQFSTDPGHFDQHFSIDWGRVAQHYQGIEFPEIFGYQAMWYKGIMVPSGCVWDVKAIQALNPIFV